MTAARKLPAVRRIDSHLSALSRSAQSASPPGEDENRLLTTKEAATYTPYTAHVLENLRSAGKGPAYIKIRGGAVAYRLGDLLAWQLDHRISTLDQK